MMRVVWLVLLFLMAPFSVAEGDVSQLHLHLSGAQSLKADFTQTVRDADGSVLQNSKGSIELSRPNKIRWQSREPFQYLLVSDGATLWRYDADLEQLNVEPFDPSLAQAPAMILGASIHQLDENFRVALEKRGVNRSFILTPKGTGGNFTELVLHFERGKLTGMALSDTLEQRTEIEFLNPVYNKYIPPSRFVLDEDEVKGH